MICPLNKLAEMVSNKWEGGECDKSSCAWWDSKANYNPETKQFEGQCCILTLSRLKLSGGINTHAY